MPVTVAHTTPSDGSFSATGAAAWDANHSVVGLGTLAEQNSNNVSITGGSITGVSGLGTVTSVGGTGTVSGLTLTGTVTSSGSLTLGGTLSVTPSNFASQTANTFLAAPNGASGTPTFRAIVAADVPTLNQNTTGTAANVTGTVAVANGGTGQTTYTDGQLLIGNTTGNTLAKATLTAGTNISITNGAGAITINATDQFVGTVTSVSGTGTVNGITLTGTVTSSGSLTLGGTLSGVDLATQTTGTLSVSRGGTGATTLTGVVKGNGTSAFTAGTVSLTTEVSGTLPVANGGTGVTTSTGTTSVVLSNSPTLVTPTLGAASATSIATGLGAGGTPAYTFTGDTNTGMWSPGADTLAFSEGGVEAMRIDSSGNVGIGTTSPTLGKLVVSQASSGTATFALESQGSWNASIAANSSGNLIFNNNAATERARIDSSGNVGIGTSAPATRLHVAGTGSGPTLRLENQTASTGKTYEIISGDGGPLRFQDTTVGVERMRIASAGNVGIGTSSPNSVALLDVSSTTAGFLPPRMTTVQRALILTPPNGLMLYNTTTDKLQVYAAGAWVDLH